MEKLKIVLMQKYPMDKIYTHQDESLVFDIFACYKRLLSNSIALNKRNKLLKEY